MIEAVDGNHGYYLVVMAFFALLQDIGEGGVRLDLRISTCGIKSGKNDVVVFHAENMKGSEKSVVALAFAAVPIVVGGRSGVPYADGIFLIEGVVMF